MSRDAISAEIRRERILGISFFNGSVVEAVEHLRRIGGYMVAPVSPALTKLNYDQDYRLALEKADLAIADSGLLVILWRCATGRRLVKISGLAYLKCLVDRAGITESAFWIVSSDAARVKTLDWLRKQGPLASADNIYVVPQTAGSAEHYSVLLEIEARRPSNIILAIGGGAQEKFGLYLRDYLRYRPSIHCLGAALGFLTGEERPIPDWADRSHMGWVLRLLSQPGMLLPRLWIAFELASMIFRFRSELPPLRKHWADV